MRVVLIQRYAAAFRRSLFEQLGEKVDLSLIISDDMSEIKSDVLIDNCNIVTKRYFDFLFGMVHLQQHVLRTLQKLKPDVVVITPTPRNLTNFFIISFCKKHDIRIVGWGMGKMPNRHPILQMGHDFLVGLLVRKLDHMICYSSAAELYYRKLGMSDQATTIAYNGIDTLANVTPPLTTDYFSNANNLQVITVGRLIPSKQFDMLIRAMSGLKDCHLHLVGDGEEKQHLLEIANEVGTSVTFHGYKTGQELHQLLASSDIFVLPSLGGLAIHEAMFSGCPVICGTADGTEFDLVISGRTGFRLSNMNTDNLRQALIKCKNNRSNLDKMGKLARRFILLKRSRKQLLQNYLSALSS